MQEVKFKTRIKNAVDAFFENEDPPENGALDFVGAGRMAKPDDEQNFVFAPRSFVNFLKQALLFFPGTFLLFYISMGTGIVMTRMLLSAGDAAFFSRRMAWIYLVGFFAIFMTWFGLGDPKNKKHLAIPASIIVTGTIIGVKARLTENIFWIAEKIVDDFGFALYFFPVGLIVPFLVKGWVDKKADKA